MNAKNVLALLAAAGLGALAAVAWMAGDGDPQATGAPDGPCAGGAAPDHWAAPMDPAYRRDGPGKSPMGMDLIPVCPGASGEGADVVVSPQVMQSLGVRTATVTQGRLAAPVAAVGTVAYDEDSFRMIHARAEGWVERLGVASPGVAVESGAELYALFAPKLVAAASEYLSARESGRESLVSAARERLLALGYRDSQIAALNRGELDQQRLSRSAPMTGVVAELGVRSGQFIMPGTHIMTLASLQRVWVLADVPERDAARIRPGQPARLSVAAWPGREWSGQVDMVYPALDNRTRTLKLRLTVDNGDGALRPNMFARLSISAEASAPGLLIPQNALIRGANGDRVVLALGDGRFRISPVRSGQAGGGQVLVLEGLQAGDEVVIDGQFLIDSESNVDVEARRLSRPAPPRGQAMAVIRGLHGDRIELEHGPISPLGDGGITMPAMQMHFELGEAVDAAALAVGQSVHVLIENPAPGRYQVTQVHRREPAPTGHHHQETGP